MSKHEPKVDFDHEDDVLNYLMAGGLTTEQRTKRIHEVEQAETERVANGKADRPRVGDALNAARSQPPTGDERDDS